MKYDFENIEQMRKRKLVGVLYKIKIKNTLTEKRNGKRFQTMNVKSFCIVSLNLYYNKYYNNV